MAAFEPVTSAVSRLLAPNPGPMTLDGTNTYLLRGAPDGAAVVIDPGPADEWHLSRIAEQGPIELVVLTHHHPDHAEGADRLRSLTGAPVAAFEADLCQGSPTLQDGDVHDEGGLQWQVLHTPGHSADSVCLVLPGERAVLTGDTVLGRGTTVVAHPDGRLGDYLQSLRQLRTVCDGKVETVLPGHGPIGRNSLQMLDFYLRHRQERLDQVAMALDELGATATPMEIVRHVYADVDPAVWPAAELSVRAQLDYLAAAGRRATSP
jgi:glyoxylase-like metal-dependent hydrolase (beta-lactamase superfamily II)